MPSHWKRPPSSALPLAASPAAPPAPAALAGEADVLSAEAQCNDDRVCRFVVTLRHADEGWKHYADRWEVLSPEGELLATRVLRHPHVVLPTSSSSSQTDCSPAHGSDTDNTIAINP